MTEYELSVSEILHELAEVRRIMTHNLNRIHALKDHISAEGYEHDTRYYERKIAALDAAFEAATLSAKPRPFFSGLVSRKAG